MRPSPILLAALLLAPGLALAQPAPAPGRYQVTATAGAPPIMIDTVTGQSWVLVQTPGPPVQWAPLRFWNPGNTLTPLPPGPGVVGNRATPG